MSEKLTVFIVGIDNFGMPVHLSKRFDSQDPTAARLLVNACIDEYRYQEYIYAHGVVAAPDAILYSITKRF